MRERARSSAYDRESLRKQVHIRAVESRVRWSKFVLVINGVHEFGHEANMRQDVRDVVRLVVVRSGRVFGLR